MSQYNSIVDMLTTPQTLTADSGQHAPGGEHITPTVENKTTFNRDSWGHQAPAEKRKTTVGEGDRTQGRDKAV